MTTAEDILKVIGTDLPAGDQSLFQNKWIEVVERDSWYTLVKLPKDGVAVLGYRPGSKEVLIRYENNPAHGGFLYTGLTGTIEFGDNPISTAIKEVREESGYIIEAQELVSLGWVYPVKFSDFKLHLFGVNLTDKNQGEIKGDGTQGEQGAQVKWVAYQEGIMVADMSTSAILARLIHVGVNLV